MYWVVLIIILGLVALALTTAIHFSNVGLRLTVGFFLIIFGAVLFTGIDYKTGEVTTRNITSNQTALLDNITTTTTGSITETNVYQYEKYDGLTLNGIALIIVLVGVLLLFFRPLENEAENNGND